jgi:pantetheine-phosphate adenylyltransferase
VTIGLTSDKFIFTKNKKAYPFNIRKQRLIKYLESKNYTNYEIISIDDEYGPTLSEDFDAIVVSPETRGVAHDINRKRKQSGLKPLKIIEIPFVLAEDNLPISSSRIKKGVIDENGKRLNS